MAALLLCIPIPMLPLTPLFLPPQSPTWAPHMPVPSTAAAQELGAGGPGVPIKAGQFGCVRLTPGLTLARGMGGLTPQSVCLGGRGKDLGDGGR